ncbi:MAG: DUF86 domain-containing protein [Armatimonadota bacterium]|jgi:uncharacterized protein with HEPN domain
MRPDDRDAGCLLDMLQHARGVVRALRGRTLDDYLRDEDLRLAVERRLEIIGEGARRVSQAFQSAHREIPWRKIIAQQNVLAHEYGEVQDDLVWQVGTVSVPELIGLLEPLVPPAPEAEE